MEDRWRGDAEGEGEGEGGDMEGEGGGTGLKSNNPNTEGGEKCLFWLEFQMKSFFSFGIPKEQNFSFEIPYEKTYSMKFPCHDDPVHILIVVYKPNRFEFQKKKLAA